MTTALSIGIVNAEALETHYSSTSYESFSQEAANDTHINIVSKSNLLVISDQISGKSTGETREEIEARKIKLYGETKSVSSRRISDVPAFTIYNATTTLSDDIDLDGYYQTLSVAFDADIHGDEGNDVSEVYALLYLSENGGPWVHYYTTDDFIIHNVSDNDEYEVTTTFVEGFYPAHYELLIDLYQVGYPYRVATFNADDSTALYALPIESREYSQGYGDSRLHYQGGSFSVLSILFLFFGGMLRLFSVKRLPESRN